jgi:hypothetical protein
VGISAEPSSPLRYSFESRAIWPSTEEAGAEGEKPQPFQSSCGVPWRHTNATHSYAENKDPKLIQQSLGHADISTTMGLYVDETAGESTAKLLSKNIQEE